MDDAPLLPCTSPMKMLLVVSTCGMISISKPVFRKNSEEIALDEVDGH
jgi:hypothetical protein